MDGNCDLAIIEMTERNFCRFETGNLQVNGDSVNINFGTRAGSLISGMPVAAGPKSIKQASIGILRNGR